MLTSSYTLIIHNGQKYNNNNNNNNNINRVRSHQKVLLSLFLRAPVVPRDPLACSLVEGHWIDYTPNSLLPTQKQPDVPEAILTKEAAF